MSPWLDVMAHPPKEGQWAIVLCDEQMNGHWYLYPPCGLPPRPRFFVTCARVRSVDPEQGPTWERWQMASGFPLGDSISSMVTHYQPLPSVPDWANEDTPLPEWTKYD